MLRMVSIKKGPGPDKQRNYAACADCTQDNLNVRVDGEVYNSTLTVCFIHNPEKLRDKIKCVPRI